jgi:hypothetical protein
LHPLPRTQSSRPPHSSQIRLTIFRETPLVHLRRTNSPRMVEQWSLPAAGLLRFPTFEAPFHPTSQHGGSIT